MSAIPMEVQPRAHWARRLCTLLLTGLATLAGSIGTASIAHAAIPSQVAIEGALTAAGGAPAADGYYNVTFAVFKDATAGNPLWIEGPVSISVKGSAFQYILGSKTPIQASVFSGLPSAYLSMKVESDPELPRQPMTAVVYALRAAVAEGIECSGCVGASALDPQVLSAYVKTTDLNAYAKTASLAKVATTGAFADLTGGPDLTGYAKTSDLSAYAKSAGLAKVATTGAFADLSGGPDLSGYAKTTDLAAYVKAASLAKVAGSGAYADLSGTPTPVSLGKTCGSGLVMNGINADGSYACIASAIAPDMIDEISNGLIYNQFVDSTAGTGTIKIPDGLGAGVTDTLTFPDIGQAQKIWVNMTINNSDMSGVKVELYGPGTLNPYIIYAGGKTGTTLTTNFNTDTPIVSGDMNGDWTNKNIKGAWSITVKDTKAGGGSGGFDGDFKWSMNIQTLSNQKIQIKGNLIVDKDVSIAGNLSVTGNINNGNLRPTYRWGRVEGYDNNYGWPMGNSGDYSLGIAPSSWSNGAIIASASADKDLWRMTFVNGGRATVGGALINQMIPQYSDSNMSQHMLFLFRIKNSTANTINWAPTFWYSCGGNWSDYSSATINGANTWSTSGACYAGNCGTANPTFAVPGNRTSSVMFAISSSVGWAPAGFYHRLLLLAFTKGSLKLPAGLEFVDDLDTATGGWEQ